MESTYGMKPWSLCGSLSMKALANTVSVLQFLAGVAFLCAAGIASAWLAGFLTIVLSLPSDLMSVTTGSDLEAYPRYLLASIAIFFVFCLLVFYAIILVLVVNGQRIDKTTRHQMEYSYLILSALSLFAITDVVTSLAKYRMQAQQFSSRSSFAMFDRYRQFAIAECDKAEAHAPLAGLWIDACNLVNRANEISEEQFNMNLSMKIEAEIDMIKAKWSPIRTNVDPTDIALSRLVSVDLDIMDNTLKDFATERSNIMRLGAYAPPPIYAIVRFYGYYVLAYALALRLARTTAEAALV